MKLHNVIYRFNNFNSLPLQSAEDSGGLYSINWFRVVLDEAHTIKSCKSQVSSAAAALTAGRRWCLTGTPIQV